MATLKTLVFLQGYEGSPSASCSGNPPSKNFFKWTRELQTSISSALSETFQIAPGESQTLFSGVVPLTQDGTTQYSLALAPFQSNIYQLTNTGGTAPTFRTLRTIGTDATTQVTTSVNGPILTYTFTGGSSATYAKFTGLTTGMTTPVTITANTIGTVGNSVALIGDGTSNLDVLINNWNISNPSNQIALTSGNGAQIPAVTYASFTGIVVGLSTSVTITANNAGPIGNSVVLTGDGISSVNLLISNWNTANPSNQITLTSGDGTQVPVGNNFANFIGIIPGTSTSVTITANNIGTVGNSVILVGNGMSTISDLIANWNAANPSNRITLTSGDGSQIPSNLSSTSLAGGTLASIIGLAGGLSINLSGGMNSSAPVNLSSVIPGDNVLIGNDFNTLNQGATGIWQIVSVTSNSFSVVNPMGYVEGPITLGSGFANQIRIFSAAGVQIGDTVVISSGFSPVSWGSYQITLVTDEWLQFSYTGSLPAEGPITTEIAVYSMAKSLVYMESDQNLSITLNGILSGSQIVPQVANGSVYPGIFMQNGSVVYSLSVTNNSINVANVTLLSAE